MDDGRRTTMTAMIEELDQRESNGISVSLLWDRRTNAVSVYVYDATNEEGFELACDADNALDIFHHPFAYAARRNPSYGSAFRLAPT
jgi:hypothetical protein